MPQLGNTTHVGSILKNPIILTSKSEDQGAMNSRLQLYLGVLKSMGITDLSSLGNLHISGDALADVGLTTPKSVAAATPQTRLFSYAFKRDPAQANFVRFGGVGTVPNAEPWGTAAGARTGAKTMNFLDLWSFFAADWIDLADNTNLVVTQPNLYVVILARKITVGSNVTLTYQRKTVGTPTVPPKPSKPATPTIQVAPPFSKGKDPTAGTAGQTGGVGASFVNNPAPSVELWTLDLNGPLSIDLQGQDGEPGGRGADGGDGGNGGQGSNSTVAWGSCERGPGPGGDGGTGGRAGDGGKGGDGGPGGHFTFCAPQDVINAFASAGSFIAIDGGKAGPGGAPGTPGSPGAGGPIGINNHTSLCTTDPSPGNTGSQGAPGNQGPSGQPGPRFGDAIKFSVIDANDFTAALLRPAIIDASSENADRASAKEGDKITLIGQNFTQNDVVKVREDDGSFTPCATTMSPSNGASFILPKLPGGPRVFLLEQPDGTRSNFATISVLPTLTSIENGPRARPGSTIKIFGTGFAKNMRVMINGQDVSGATFLDPHTIQAKIIRPVAGVSNNPSGDDVGLKVALPDLTPSNEIRITLDTYRIFVFGDSIQWGTGLKDSEKFSTLVSDGVKWKIGGGVAVHTTVYAHTGAVIGGEQTATGNATDGEVPNSYPTINQQVDLASGVSDAKFIDLILLDGGINDVGLSTMFHWDIPEATLWWRVTQACLTDMTALLIKVSRSFVNAKIIVTGYYAPLNQGSDDAGSERLIIAMLAAFGFHVLTIDPFSKSAIKNRCIGFATRSNLALSQAVAAANSSLSGPPRVFFADPHFGPSNSAFGSDPWVFGVNGDFSPQDSLAGARAELCNWEAPRGDRAFCKRASMGHPNPKGAQHYAENILLHL